VTDEPSWTTALSEADAASRHLRQATAALERLTSELRALRGWSDTTARIDLARALSDGPDGGALGALVAAASDPEADPSLRRTAESLVARLETALGLERVGERGERLRLTDEDLAELEVRGGPLPSGLDGAGLYCVVRPGWLLDGLVVVRPMVEHVAPSEASPRAAAGESVG